MHRVEKAGNMGRGPLQPSLPTRVVYVAASGERVATLVRWSFLLFVFTIPFETMKAGFTSDSLSLTKAAGFLFFAACLAHPKRCFPRPPVAMWWFIGYIVIYTLSGLFIPEQFLGSFFGGLLTRIQLIILLWVASSLLRDEKLARSALLAFSMALVLLSLGMIFKIPGFYVPINEGRATAVGANANELAFNTACAVLIIIGLRSDKSLQGLWYKALPVISLLPLLVALTLTGSREGIGGLVIGASLYLFSGQSFKRKKALILWAILTIVTMIYMVLNNPAVSARWERTYYQGNTSGRDTIYAAAIAMISERPIFGWQPVRSYLELGRRVKVWSGRDAHNLYLHLLIEVGFVGTVPFLVGLWLCVRAAWKAREGKTGIMPLALVATLLAVSVTGTPLVSKTMWLLLALSLASASILPAEQWLRARVLVKDQSSNIGRQRYWQWSRAKPKQVTRSQRSLTIGLHRH
jgi:O-antigen ligase